MFTDFGGRGRESERERNIDVREKYNWVSLPPLGIEPTTFWCMGPCSNQPSNPARAPDLFSLRFIFIAVLGSQKNRLKSTDTSYILHIPAYA